MCSGKQRHTDIDRRRERAKREGETEVRIEKYGDRAK